MKTADDSQERDTQQHECNAVSFFSSRSPLERECNLRSQAVAVGKSLSEYAVILELERRMFREVPANSSRRAVESCHELRDIERCIRRSDWWYRRKPDRCWGIEILVPEIRPPCTERARPLAYRTAVVVKIGPLGSTCLDEYAPR